MTNTSNTTMTRSRNQSLTTDAALTSVSLKIGRTSVMLYANHYRKPNDGSAGYSTQEYLGSFSVNATSIPAAFDALMRQATVGRPERYLELLQRLKTRVLEPARERQRLLDLKHQREQIIGMLDFAALQIDSVSEVPNAAGHVVHSTVQSSVLSILEGAQRLLVQAECDAPSIVNDEASAVSPETVRADDSEQRLQALLATINEACKEVASMMPESAKRFRRGHLFEQETIAAVQRTWFNSSDAIAALNGRGQLKRPKNWDMLRPKVNATL